MIYQYIAILVRSYTQPIFVLHTYSSYFGHIGLVWLGIKLIPTIYNTL